MYDEKTGYNFKQPDDMTSDDLIYYYMAPSLVYKGFTSKEIAQMLIDSHKKLGKAYRDRKTYIESIPQWKLRIIKYILNVNIW